MAVQRRLGRRRRVAALDESGGLESAAEREGKWGSGSGTEMPCQQATDATDGANMKKKVNL